jgi:transcriptional regulator with XRE-family HTH domain
VGKSLPTVALGQVIRRLREDQGLQQDLLAQRAGISSATVSFIERRMVDPRWSTLEKIGRVLDVSMGEIGRLVVKQEAAREDDAEEPA